MRNTLIQVVLTSILRLYLPFSFLAHLLLVVLLQIAKEYLRNNHHHWKHPNLWKRLTIYQGIEKVLALYYVTWREGKHCSNYSTWHFYKEIKLFRSQYFQSICVLNICFIVFSFLCAFIPNREFLPFSRSFAYFIWLHWILVVACGI